MFSWEGISKVPAEELGEHFSALGEALACNYGVKLKVILLIRRQQDWFISRYIKDRHNILSKRVAPLINQADFMEFTQKVIDGKIKGRASPDYFNIINALARSIPKNHIHVDLYERLSDDVFWENIGEFMDLHEIEVIGKKCVREKTGYTIEKKETDWFVVRDNVSLKTLTRLLVKKPYRIFRLMSYKFPIVLRQSDEYMGLLSEHYSESNKKVITTHGLDLHKYGYFVD